MSIRRMTHQEQTAYRLGYDDAEAGRPLDPRRHDLFARDHVEAYERGYRNQAGESLNG